MVAAPMPSAPGPMSGHYADSTHVFTTLLAVAAGLIVLVTFVYTIKVGTVLLTDSRLPYRALINNVNAILAESLRRQKRCAGDVEAPQPDGDPPFTQGIDEEQRRENRELKAEIKRARDRVTRLAAQMRRPSASSRQVRQLEDQIERLELRINDLELKKHNKLTFQQTIFLGVAREVDGTVESVSLQEALSGAGHKPNPDADPRDFVDYGFEEKSEPWYVGWHTSGSETTKWVTTYMAWSWASAPLVLVVCLGTLTYDGFFVGHLQFDAVPRLVLVGVMTAAQLVHTAYTCFFFDRFLRLVLQGAAWSLLQRARFTIIRSDHQDLDRKSIITIYKASASFKSRGYGEDAPTTVEKTDKENSAKHEQAWKQMEDSLKKFGAVVTAESKAAAEKTASTALIYLTIAVTYGFTVWTSAPSTTLTTQIGSWGLLVSTVAAMSLMMASSINMASCNSAYARVVWYKETAISQNHKSVYDKTRHEYYPFGYSVDTIKRCDYINRPSWKEWSMILHRREWWRCLKIVLLGPAFQTVPKSLRETNTHLLNVAGDSIIVDKRGNFRKP